MIRHEHGRWNLYGHGGRLLGSHRTETEAKEQESAINISKARAAGHHVPDRSAYMVRGTRLADCAGGVCAVGRTAVNGVEGVPETIIAQLDAKDQWLRARLGVSQMVSTDDGVTLKLPAGKSLTITLASDDTYTLQLWSLRGANFKVLKNETGIYADQLPEVVESMVAGRGHAGDLAGLEGTTQAQVHALYRAAVAADDAWQQELVRVYGGRGAADARYTSAGGGAPGSTLQKLKAAKRLADHAYSAAVRERVGDEGAKDFERGMGAVERSPYAPQLVLVEDLKAGDRVVERDGYLLTVTRAEEQAGKIVVHTESDGPSARRQLTVLKRGTRVNVIRGPQGSGMGGPSEELEEILEAWRRNRAYVDSQGNYHLKAPGQNRGPIAPWNALAKRTFPDVDSLHAAAQWKKGGYFAGNWVDDMNAEAEQTEEGEEATVEDDDISTGDHVRFYQHSKLWLTIDRDATDAEMKAAIRAKMEKEQFFPNVWFVSDHGNLHRIDLSDGGLGWAPWIVKEFSDKKAKR